MCYNARTYIAAESIGGVKVEVSSSIATNVTLTFHVPVSIQQLKPARYYGGKQIPSEMRGFMIESASFSISNYLDEDLLTTTDTDKRGWLNGAVTIYGRWVLKSGGTAKDSESREINISELPPNIVQAIHQAMAIGLDKMYNEVSRMYDNYSKFINESYSISK